LTRAARQQERLLASGPRAAEDPNDRAGTWRLIRYIY